MKRMSAKRLAGMIVVCMLCVTGISIKAEAAAKGMYLISSEGDVSLRSAGGRSLKRFENMKPENGSVLETGENGSARIGVGDDGELLLKKGGKAEFRGGKNASEFLLSSGTLTFDLTGEEAFSIRTPISAFVLEQAEGSISIEDACHAVISLEAGEARCSVTDPVSGQTKAASLTGGEVVECVVYPDGEDGERCDILIRKAEQESPEIESIADAGKQETPEGITDPVWTGNAELAKVAAEEAKQQEMQLAEALTPEDDEEEIAQSSIPHEQTAAAFTQEKPQAAAGAGSAAVSDGGSASGAPVSGGGSGSGASSGGGSGSDTLSSGSQTGSGSSGTEPGTTPSEPEELTSNQGILVKSGRNNGVIKVKNGGEILIGNGNNTLMNYGQVSVINDGKISGTIKNNAEWMDETISDAIFKPEEEEGEEEKVEICVNSRGHITKVVNTKNGGRIEVEGSGWVEDGIEAYGGELILHKNSHVKAKTPIETLKVDTTDASVEIAWSYSKYLGSGKWEDGAETWSLEKGDEFAAFYVTGKEDDGLACIYSLRPTLTKAAEDMVANDSYPKDTVTLSADMTERRDDSENGFVNMCGGTKEKPIVLDLNGKTLKLEKVGYAVNDKKIQMCFLDGAFWKIEGKGEKGEEYGEINFVGGTNSEILVDANSTLMVNETMISNGNLTCNFQLRVDGSNSLIEIKNSVLNLHHCNSNNSDGYIYVYSGGEIRISDCEIDVAGVKIKTDSDYKEKDPTLVSIDNCEKVTIQGRGIELLPLDDVGATVELELSNSNMELSSGQGNNLKRTISASGNSKISMDESTLSGGINASGNSEIFINNDSTMIGQITASDNSKISIKDTLELIGQISVEKSATLEMSGGEIVGNSPTPTVKYDCGSDNTIAGLVLNGATITNNAGGAGLRIVLGEDDDLDSEKLDEIINNNTIQTWIDITDGGDINKTKPIEIGSGENYSLPNGYTRKIEKEESLEPDGNMYIYACISLVRDTSQIAEQALFVIRPDVFLPDVSGDDPEEGKVVDAAETSEETEMPKKETEEGFVEESKKEAEEESAEEPKNTPTESLAEELKKAQAENSRTEEVSGNDEESA